MTAKKKLEVEGVDAVGPKVLAENIVKLSDGARLLLNGPLKRRVILLLLKDSTGVSLVEIDRVLTGLADLKSDYVK